MRYGTGFLRFRFAPFTLAYSIWLMNENVGSKEFSGGFAACAMAGFVDNLKSSENWMFSRPGCDVVRVFGLI